MMAGIFAGVLTSRAAGTAVYLWLLIPLVVGVSLMWLRREWYGSIAVFMAFGMFWGAVRAPGQVPGRLDGTHGVLTGRIAAVVESVNRDVFDMDDCRYTCRDSVYSLPNVRIRMYVSGEHARLYVGDRVRADGRMDVLAGADADVREAPTPDLYLRGSGVAARFFSRDRCVYTGVSRLSCWERVCIDMHDGLRNAVYAAGFAPGTTDFILSVVAGDSEALDSVTRDDFRVVGLAHILALSGMHVGIIATLAAALLFALRAVGRLRWMYYLALVLAVTAYAVAAGMTPSVARAATMSVIFALAAWMQTRVSAYNVLAVTVFVWLLINPMWLWSPGFQLSCIAVLALCILYTRLGHWLAARPVVGGLVLWIAVPVVAVVATSLLTVMYFHSLPVWFLPVNMIAAVLVTPLIGLAAFTMIIAAIGIPASWPAMVCDRLYVAVDVIISWFKGLPLTQIDGLFLSPWQAVGWGLAVVCVFWLIAGGRRNAWLCLTASVLLFTAASISKPSRPQIEVYVPRLASGTSLIVGFADTVMEVTLNSADNREYLRRHCAALVAARGADSLGTAPISFDSRHFIRRGEMMWIADRTLLAVNNAGDIARARATHINYLFVTDAYRGKIRPAIDSVHVDTILLAADLPVSTRRHIVQRLDSLSQPYIDLGRRNWRLLYK